MRLGLVALVLAATLQVQADVAKRIEHGSSPSAFLETARTPKQRLRKADEPPAGLSRDDWNQIRRVVQGSEYHARRMARAGHPPALEASNRRQAYRTTFRREGIEIAPQSPSASWRLGLSVIGYGYQGDIRPVKATEPRAHEERVEYRRGPVTEWYVNRPRGLEQGFELKEPHHPRRAGPLIVAMALQSDLEASSRDGVSFGARSGQTLVRYAGTEAWDAEGRPLRSRLEAAGREIRLLVEADAARFPVTVDPTFVHEAQLFGYGDGMPPPNAQFGSAVAVSGDTAVVGMPLDDTGAGADAGSAYVFLRSGTVWTMQQRLEAPDGASPDQFGAAVSIDNDTLVVGAPIDGAGSAYVFVRSGTTWTLQQKVSAGGFGTFGRSLSLVGDTVVIGAPGGIDPGAAYVFVRSGTVWTEQQKLVAFDGAAADEFGSSVSVSGDTVAAGTPNEDNGGGTDAGSVYVFVRAGTTWTLQQKVLAPDGAAFDHFGSATSSSGDTLVAAAPGDDNTKGSAYVFVRVGSVWTLQQKLVALDGVAGDLFGSSVSQSGETVLVGARGDDTPIALDAGSAYVWVRSGATWSEQQKLLGSEVAASGDGLGYSVSLSGDTVVVGAPQDFTPAGLLAGSAYVFVRSGTVWTEQQKLFASDGAPVDAFGESVSVSGDTLVVGARQGDSPAGADTGSAYVFVRTGTIWTEQQKLFASDATNADRFGVAASISGDTVVVGAPNDDNAGGIDAGSAYVFVRSGTVWTEQQKLLASDGAAGDFFSTSISLSADTVVGGAPGDDNVGGTSAGAAYVFVRSGTNWSEQQKLLASDGSSLEFLGDAVAISGDTAVMTSGNGKGAYVFVRSGTIWSEQQKLVAPGGMPSDHFGISASVSGDTIVVGASSDDTPAGGTDAGSVHVFREALADLGVTKTDGQTTAVPGQPLTYTITVSNAGPTSVVGAAVADTVPAVLAGVTWTCSASAGSTCTASGSGNINDTVALLAGGTATYTLTGTVDPAATGTLVNTATVTAPAGVDPNPANNTATDIDTLTPLTDLSIAKTDSVDPVVPGGPLRYDLAIGNLGPSEATAVTVVDNLPAGVSFVSSVPGPPTCTLAGATVTCGLGSLAAGGSAAVTINTIVNGSVAGVLVNTATVSGAESDPVPANNSASEPTTIKSAVGELAHGATFFYDLAAQPGPAADEDVFRISQKPYSSYEVVVDATSGDIGAGSGPFVERVAPDGITVLQASIPIGTGSSRSLRWSNTTSVEVDDQTVRVRSAQCGTDCGPETTYSVPRFNNAGTQITVLVLQNPTNYPISGEVYFAIPSGALVAVQGFTLGPKATVVLNTATVPGANGVSGAITVAHNGRYGDLAGKTVAVEPATGLSFDSPLVPRVP